LSFWILLKGAGHDGILTSNDVEIISGGIFEQPIQIPPNYSVVDLKILKYQVEKIGYLYYGNANVSNIYNNQEESSPYQLSFVFKEGYDSVAVLIYFIKDKQIFVGTIENLRPTLHIRKLFKLPKRDNKVYLYFRGIIAGALEKLDGEGDEFINQRAAQEVREEAGFEADPNMMLDLGYYFTSPGYCLEKMYLRAYELKSFTHKESSGDGTLYEEGIRIYFREIRDVLSMYSDNIFEDPKTEIAIRRLCSKLGYIPELDIWYDEINEPLKAKYRRLFI